MIVCYYFCSAGVKVMTLLMLLTADTGVSPRLAGAVMCRCWVEIDDSGNGRSEKLCAHINSCSDY